MEMQRHVERELDDWLARGARKPFFLLGARQVGKTHVVERFLDRAFSDHITLTLTDRPDVVDLFAENRPTEDKIERLQLLLGRRIDFEQTAIFFDEAQASEHVIAAAKFFAESPVPYKIVCAGSLLGVKLNRFSQSFPVGQAELHYLAPMDFEEFLWANGRRDLADQIRACFEADEPMSAPLHSLCLDLCHAHMAVGGMPEAVADLVGRGGDVMGFEGRILDDIRASYLADMTKYVVSKQESVRIEAIYDSIPSQLGNAAGKFQYAGVAKGARSRDYESALSWLVASGMVLRCAMVTTAEMPLKGFERDGFFKLFLSDTGLLCSALGLRRSAIMLDEDFRYKGVVAENYTAAQLAVSGPLFYWRHDNSGEVDFLLDRPEGIVPVEVKAGRDVRSASLDAYRRRFTPPYAIRVSARNFGRAEGFKSIPLYAVFCL
jgi:predicted AAA+ superfamily ATPase